MAKLHYHRETKLHLQVRDRILNLLIRSGGRRGDPVPTYRDLTQRLNVSLVTVQRAMDELIKEEIVYGWPGKGTYIARELSAEARKLTQIGLVMYCSRQLFFSSPYLMEIFQGVMLSAEMLNVDVRIFSIKSEGGLSARQIAESGVDGVLLVGVVNDEYIAELARECAPLVVADYCSKKVAADFVACDNTRATAEMIAYQHTVGHRRIAYVDGWSTDTVPGRAADPVVETSDLIERREAYLKAMQDLGLAEYAHVFSVDRENPSALVPHITESWTSLKKKPTALVANSSNDAARILQGFKCAQIRVPQDVSVAAVAGAGADAQAGEMSLTYQRMQFIDMGRKAVELLNERCRQLRPLEAQIHRVGYTFVSGNTSAGVPS